MGVVILIRAIQGYLRLIRDGPKCVHKTAKVRSFMGIFWRDRKVSIELLRYAVLWKLLWRVRKVSIKLLRSAVFKLGPKSVYRTAEVRSSGGPQFWRPDIQGGAEKCP